MIRFKNFKIRPWTHLSEEERAELLAWVVNICRTFGATWNTSLLVAAAFADGLEKQEEETSGSVENKGRG